MSRQSHHTKSETKDLKSYLGVMKVIFAFSIPPYGNDGGKISIS